MTVTLPQAVPLEFSLAWDEDGPADLGEVTPTAWQEARDGLAEVSTYWLATVRKGGRPHLVPVLAVMVDDAPHFCASDRSRKARKPSCPSSPARKRAAVRAASSPPPENGGRRYLPRLKHRRLQATFQQVCRSRQPQGTSTDHDDRQLAHEPSPRIHEHQCVV
jgi:hypothetical protein